jgi:ABC-type branched-subunit amino acid transport system substrate-binding protein
MCKNFADKKGVFLLLVLAVLPFILSSCGNSYAIKIACNVPLTGKLASYGQSIRDGASMAAEDLAKIAPNGPRFQFDWQDNQNNTEQAKKVCEAQFSRYPDIYLSGMNNVVTEIKDSVNRRNTANFVYCNNVFINTTTSNCFRPWINLSVEPPQYMRYLEWRKAKQIAVIYPQISECEEVFGKILLPRLKEKDYKLLDLKYSPVEKNQDKNFVDIVSQVSKFKPQAILLGGNPNTLVPLIKALRATHLIANNNTVSTFALVDAAKNMTKDELEGIHVLAPTFLADDTNAFNSWSKRFQTKYGRQPSYTDAYAYDMITVIYAAAISMRLPVLPHDWINAIKDVRILGITGSLFFDGQQSMQIPLEVDLYHDGHLVCDRTIRDFRTAGEMKLAKDWKTKVEAASRAARFESANTTPKKH